MHQHCPLQHGGLLFAGMPGSRTCRGAVRPDRAICKAFKIPEGCPIMVLQDGFGDRAVPAAVPWTELPVRMLLLQSAPYRIMHVQAAHVLGLQRGL